MNLFDFIIIYLACGSPFGVYYFLQNRNLPNNKFFLAKIIFNFVCWLPFAFGLISSKDFFGNLFDFNFDKKVILDSELDSNILFIKKFFEKELIKNPMPISFYEFREICDRYVGLTLEINDLNKEISEPPIEFYRISESSNKKLAAKCLNRRNRQRLMFHQTLARRDFWEIIGNIFNNSQNQKDVLIKLSDLIHFLNDFESDVFLQKLSAESLQTIENKNISNLENELWKNEIHKPLPANQISVNIKTLAATMNLSNKD